MPFINERKIRLNILPLLVWVPLDDDGGDGSRRYVLVVVPVPNQPVFAVPGVYCVLGLEKYFITNIDK